MKEGHIKSRQSDPVEERRIAQLKRAAKANAALSEASSETKRKQLLRAVRGTVALLQGALLDDYRTRVHELNRSFLSGVGDGSSVGKSKTEGSTHPSDVAEIRETTDLVAS